MNLTFTDVSNGDIGHLSPMVSSDLGLSAKNHHRDAQGGLEGDSYRALMDEIAPFGDTDTMREAATVATPTVQADRLSQTVLNRVDELGTTATASVGTGLGRLASLGEEVAAGTMIGAAAMGSLLAGSFKAEDETQEASIWDSEHDLNNDGLPTTDMENAVAQAFNEIDMGMLANEMHFSTVEKVVGHDVNGDGVSASLNAHLPDLIDRSAEQGLFA